MKPIFTSILPKDLQVGDEFGWLSSTGLPPTVNNRFIVTEVHSEYTFSFRSKGLPLDTWTRYIFTSDAAKNLIKFINTKEDKLNLVLNKIKYLDKRFAERKAMCS